MGFMNNWDNVMRSAGDMNQTFGNEAQARIHQLHRQYQDEYGRLQQHYNAKAEENASNIQDYNQLLQKHRALVQENEQNIQDYNQLLQKHKAVGQENAKNIQDYNQLLERHRAVRQESADWTDRAKQAAQGIEDSLAIARELQTDRKGLRDYAEVLGQRINYMDQVIANQQVVQHRNVKITEVLEAQLTAHMPAEAFEQLCQSLAQQVPLWDQAFQNDACNVFSYGVPVQADLTKSIDSFTGATLENAHTDGVLKVQRP
jgi:hypothetical protein